MTAILVKILEILVTPTAPQQCVMGDFFSLSLCDGRVEFEYNLGEFTKYDYNFGQKTWNTCNAPSPLEQCVMGDFFSLPLSDGRVLYNLGEFTKYDYNLGQKTWDTFSAPLSPRAVCNGTTHMGPTMTTLV